jgi:hypothetical protein
MPDWNTRLVIQFSSDGKTFTDITPIDSFQQTIKTDAQAVHSLEQTHVGAVFSPADIQFTMTVKQSATVLADLTKAALGRTRFSIAVQKSSSSTGNDWALASIVLSNCVITSMQVGPFTLTVGQVPTMIIAGVSLHTQVTLPDNSTASAGSLA